MPFLDHLEELRWRILWSLLALIVCSVVSFGLVYYFQALELLIAPIRAAYDDPDLQLIFLSPADPFFVTLRLAIYGGIILSFPILVYQIWSFLSPALEKEERRAIVSARERAKLRGIPLGSVNDHGTILKLASHNDRFCIRLDSYIYVDVEGNVAPCCLLRGVRLGNLVQQPLDAVWNSPEFKRFYGPGPHPACTGCDAFMNGYLHSSSTGSESTATALPVVGGTT